MKLKNEIISQAYYFREKIKNSSIRHVFHTDESFPINHCDYTSYIFTYHLLEIYPELSIDIVYGRAIDDFIENHLNHTWIEIEGFLFDLTADQFNKINDNKLTEDIILQRPFRAVYAGKIEGQPHYKLFEEYQRYLTITGFPEEDEDYIDILRDQYHKIKST